MNHYHVSLAAIIGVTIICVCALFTGHDGFIIYTSLIAVSGLGGFVLGKFIKNPTP